MALYLSFNLLELLNCYLLAARAIIELCFKMFAAWDLAEMRTPIELDQLRLMACDY